MNQLVEVKYDAPTLPATTAQELAESLEIDSQDTYEFADQQLVSVMAQWKRYEGQRKAIVDPINKAKDGVQALFGPVLKDLAAAETIYKTKILGYQREQDHKRREEQAALDEAARKERERLEKLAAKEAAKGHAEKAEVLQATAAVITSPIATSTYVAPRGAYTVNRWKGRVLNKKAAVLALAEAYLNLVEIDAGALNRLAVATEGSLKISGVEFYEDKTLARRVA